MNPALWITIYLPMFIILFIVIPNQRRAQRLFKKRRRHFKMTNELIKEYIGKKCLVSTGSFGTAIQGEITRLEENWMEVTTKKGPELINVEFITTITLLKSKK